MMQTNVPFTDNESYGSHPSNPAWSNLPHDGHWDQNSMTGFLRPVAFIDFSEIPAAGGPGLVIPAGCKKGQRVCPAVDEVAALKDYFRRNMEYRTGRWIPPRGKPPGRFSLHQSGPTRDSVSELLQFDSEQPQQNSNGKSSDWHGEKIVARASRLCEPNSQARRAPKTV